LYINKYVKVWFIKIHIKKSGVGTPPPPQKKKRKKKKEKRKKRKKERKKKKKKLCTHNYSEEYSAMASNF
jgi:hypothetical protein